MGLLLWILIFFILLLVLIWSGCVILLLVAMKSLVGNILSDEDDIIY